MATIREKGITLIALVITIIVLIILAGVTIATLSGPNGILTQANEAKKRTEEKGQEEELKIKVMGAYNEQGKLDLEKVKTELLDMGVELITTSFPLLGNYQDKSIRISENGEVSIDYISKGLVTYYQAKTNTRKGYDKNTTKWEDLSGNSNDGMLHGCTWEDDCLYFDGIDDWVNMGEQNYDHVTLEVVVSNDKIGSGETLYIVNFELGGYGIGYNIGDTYKFHCFELFFKGDSDYTRVKNNKQIVEVNKMYSMSGSYNGKEIRFRSNHDTLNIPIIKEIQKPLNNTVLALGANPARETVTGSYLNGKIYSIRVYNRALTEEEVNYNYEIDKRNFSIE